MISPVRKNSPTMFKVTDAERLREVEIPLEKAQMVGIFMDMIGSLAPESADAEPVCPDPHATLVMRRLFSTNLRNCLICLLHGFSGSLSLLSHQVSPCT